MGFPTFRLVLILCVSLTTTGCNKARKASHSNTDDNNLTATNKEIESRVSGRGSAIDLETGHFKEEEKREEKSAFFKSSRDIQKLRKAVDHGLQKLEELVDVKEPLLYRMGLFLQDKQPAARVANFRASNSPKAILMSRFGFAAVEASRQVAQSFQKNVGRQHPVLDIEARIDVDDCPLRDKPRCPAASRRFRTADGTCNNLRHPWRGAAMLPMQRFLPPVYEDGIQSVRLSSLGRPLPSPREVSTMIHRDENQEVRSVTLMFAHWGQFIDHDITSTVRSRGFNGSIPRCCDDGDRRVLPLEFLHPNCLPIEVPPRDPVLGQFGIGCMEFTRSAPSTRIDCDLGWREQINQVTSYLDASMIYGSDADTSNSVRTFRNGMIFYGHSSSVGNSFPDQTLCNSGALTEECLRPGDLRASENPGLLALHTVFVRYHNKVASILAVINRHWNDERIFQETRRIVYSVIQHITYREFLPIVVGPEVTDLFELRLVRNGFYDGYHEETNAAVANSFSTAAFRFGHSMIQNSILRADSHHNPLPNNVSLHNEPFNEENIWTVGSLDRFLLGLANQPSQKRDEFVADELTNHLFQFGDATPFGMDLAAINIQRGRDHGLPPYTHWREPCGLSSIKKWSDLERVTNPQFVGKLRRLYSHVDDVDLFTAGLAERPLRGGVVGPTFACIIAQQFGNLRKGDRFWYENGHLESSFSPRQLEEIRKVSLAQVICQTMDEVESLQSFVFLSPDGGRNSRVSCEGEEMGRFDLAPWREGSFEFNSLGEGEEFEKDRQLRTRRDARTKSKKLKRTSTTTSTTTKTTTVPTRKPAYYKIKDVADDSLTYLVGVVSSTLKGQDKITPQPPLQVININIHYAQQDGLTTKKPTTYFSNYATQKPDLMNYATSNGLKRPNLDNSNSVYYQTGKPDRISSALFENRPFSTSNKPTTNNFDYYTHTNDHKPQTHTNWDANYKKDPHWDDIATEFFDRFDVDETPSVSIDGKLDFDSDGYVQIGSVKKVVKPRMLDGDFRARKGFDLYELPKPMMRIVNSTNSEKVR